MHILFQGRADDIIVSHAFDYTKDSAHILFDGERKYDVNSNGVMSDVSTGKSIGRFRIRFNEREQMLWDFYDNSDQKLHTGSYTHAESLLREELAVGIKIAKGEIVVAA